MSSSRIQASILADRAPLTVNIPPISPTSNLIEAGLFLHSGRSNKVAPDLQFLFSPAFWVGAAIAPDIPGFTLIPALINPQSCGRSEGIGNLHS
ncbi:hypothetical protein [Nostoc sp.]|uniref:hypothetical protein n=1 Tax=Nostoc sp. TaxID=1180 RepID=UPI002FFBE312